MKTKPSDFTGFPWDSKFQKCELETIAANIMVIWARTGNEFRPISYQEYCKELEKDKQVPQPESQFDTVINSGHLNNADTAQLFSKAWRDE